MVCPSSSNINSNGFSIRSGFAVDPPPAPTFNSLRRRPLIANSSSVIVARHAGGLGEALVFHRRLEHHAVGELVHHGALNLLPWCLAGRELEAAFVLQGPPPLRQLSVRNQDIGSALVEVDTDAVAGAQQRKPTVRGRLGRGIEDRRRARCAGL